MDESLSTLSAPKSTAEFKEAIHRLLNELRRLDTASERTWAEIGQIRSETSSIGARTDATFERIDAALARLRLNRSRDVEATP
jgi:hypothetical protein